MPLEQATALKAWLEKIVTDSHTQVEVAIPAIKEEASLIAKSNDSVLPEARSDQGEGAPAPVVKEDTMQESHSAPDSSSASSMSSPLQTPTPANHPPPHFDIFASQLQKLSAIAQNKPNGVSGDIESDVNHASGETVFDHPQSAMAGSGALPHSLKQTPQSAASETAVIAANEAEVGKEPFSADAGSAARISTSPLDANVVKAEEERQPPSPGHLQVPESHDFTTHNSGASSNTAKAASPRTGTPYHRTQMANDDSGWITVTSKKVRQRYDSIA
jgi:hypothetical protein